MELEKINTSKCWQIHFLELAKILCREFTPEKKPLISKAWMYFLNKFFWICKKTQEAKKHEFHVDLEGLKCKFYNLKYLSGHAAANSLVIFVS